MKQQSAINNLKQGDPELNLYGGLSVKVGARGKSYILRKRMKGKSSPLALKLGSVGNMTLQEAEEKAFQYRKLIDQGINPRDHEETEREQAKAQAKANIPNTMTLTELLKDKERWMDKGLGQSDNTRQGRYNALNNFLKPWADLPFGKITKQMIIDRYDEYAGQGINAPEAGKKGVIILRSLFTHAKIMDFWDKNNPCDGLGNITRVFEKEESSTKFLEPDEYKSFIGFAGDLIDPNQRDRLAKEYNLSERDLGYDRQPLFDAVALELLTGLREREVLGIKREDIFISEKKWKAQKRKGAFMRVEQTKQKRWFAVPITPQMFPIIQRRLYAKNRKGKLIESKYLFPSTRFEKSGEDKTFWDDRSAFETINKLMGENLRNVHRVHQLVLRHTFATVANTLGYSIDDVDRATGHLSYSRRSATYKHYVGIQADTYRHIFEEVNEALVGINEIDDLVPILQPKLENAMIEIDYLEAGIKDKLWAGRDLKEKQAEMKVLKENIVGLEER
jgi:integrase